ncbi:O-antigen polymerase related enzyme [Nitrolancea hollandica Lb]|uniref:O-antigen polymerase related enzyme n=2 Tax=Nitrolancea hollandica TaxID=1206749 RepID=I4EHZ7_9BACT|nr:O-antigen polymerase related enzyme [Nitrolancea hollandica Lb]
MRAPISYHYTASQITSSGYGRVIAVSAGILAIGIGALTAVSPRSGGVFAGAAVALWVITQRQRLLALFPRILGLLLLGYMFFGKSFAYLGIPPVYVGEAVLLIAILTITMTARRARLNMLHMLLFAFMTLGLIDTLPYVASDGLDAARDAVLWGYGLFAIALSFAVRAEHLSWIVSRYRKILPMFLIWVPIAAVVAQFLGSALPTVPGTEVSILVFKAGDMNVHLGGAAAFLLLGLYTARPTGVRIPVSLLWPLWFIGYAIAGVLNRGGLLAAGAGIAVIVLLRPSRRSLPFLWTMILIIVLLGLVNPKITFQSGREMSLGQITSNITSIIGNDGGSGSGNLEGTREWRLLWWENIVNYTVHGPYFWTGKGFGINLADDDGFQVRADGSLRSPHNSHMTILARMGVPGIALWVLLQGAFGVNLLRAFWRARKAGDPFWARVDAWLLVYWLAMIVNTSFDVYLEGPQGGIWFWSIFGLGMAALRLQRQPLAVTEPLPPQGGHQAAPA